MSLQHGWSLCLGSLDAVLGPCSTDALDVLLLGSVQGQLRRQLLLRYQL